jgi:hypothetical protein
MKRRRCTGPFALAVERYLDRNRRGRLRRLEEALALKQAITRLFARSSGIRPTTVSAAFSSI